MSAVDFVWALIEGGVAAIVVIAIWKYIWTPFRMHRDMEQQLAEVGGAEAFPRVDVDANGHPVLFVSEGPDGGEVRHIILRNTTITARDAPVSLDWRLHLTTDWHKYGLQLEDPCRAPVEDWERTVRKRGWAREGALTPPRDYPRPGSKHGYVAFELDRGPHQISSGLLGLDKPDPDDVYVTLVVRDRQTDTEKRFAVDRPLEPDNFRVFSE